MSRVQNRPRVGPLRPPAGTVGCLTIVLVSGTGTVLLSVLLNVIFR